MKIICKDNFDRESVSDKLIAENVDELYLQSIVDYLNNRYGGNSSPDFFKTVEDNYKLYVYNP